MERRVKPRILVVDDNADNRALAQATLEDEDCEVLTASNGEDGIRAFEATHPDCILLDVRMPGTDGFAVCARIRMLPGGKETPIVFLTALRDVDTFDQALRAGADDFLTKPVRPTELVVRVQAALKLRRMTAELREHYELVRRQRDDLMRLQLQKERLTSFVVHDLKNPVTSMDLHAQLLLRGTGLTAQLRESAQHIRSEARSLLRLLLNLLDISKSEEGRLVLRPSEVKLEQLTTELFEAMALKAETGSVKLESSIHVPLLHADADLLRRVLENLLDNAIRHAPPGTTVSLSAKAQPGAVELRVADQGPGIPPELTGKIFERFARSEASATGTTRAGTGLGLAFCKLAVEAHGGTLAVETESQGAVFLVRIPNG
jgi:two-component system sensor histidine kinase/response regulator